MSSIAIAASTINVPFHGSDLYVVSVGNEAFTPMRPIIDGMGLTYQGQADKLKTRFSKGVREIMIPTKGGEQTMLCLALRKLNGWLQTISPNKVKPEIRDKVIQYQEECDDVLYEYWTKGLVVNPRKAAKKALPGKITIEQQEAVKQLVMNRGKALPKENQAKAMITMWSALKTHFGCSYKEINEDQFTDALSLAARVPIEGEFLGKQESLPSPKISYPMSWFDSYRWIIGERALSSPWAYPVNMLTPDADYPNPCGRLLDDMKNAGYEVDAALFHLLSLQHHVQMLRHKVRAVERAVGCH
ncbi:phage antirepressor N-terminal domain-containing protein [Yersinia proxima]|uniref:phage antirepressor N-terminal domain-containing protein n=1 Tax=Yersinia proxima TaxID=2890316 RepID=UPI002A4E16F5|nr:phage antirepressor N-terminal domain-containing protein [Yersinia proxima]